MTRNAPRYLQSKTQIAASTYFKPRRRKHSAWSASLHPGDSNSLSETGSVQKLVIQTVAVSFKVEPGAERYSLAGPDYDASNFTSSVR